MRYILLLSTVAALSGCGTVTSEPMTLSDGSAGHLIECNGNSLSLGDCQKRAGEICSNGFFITDADEIARPFRLDNIAGTVSNRYMIVRCKPN